MADAATAVRVAIDLIQMPSRARMMRDAALPDGMPLLLRIAAMEADAIAEAAKLTGRTTEVVQQAAAFFVEQILLAPDSNSYRVLGATPQASSSDLRRNMAYLVRWLHPDTQLTTDRTTFVNRVTFAWDDLKTADRRAAYDLNLRDSLTLRDSKKPASVGSKPSKKPKPRSQLSHTLALDGAAQPANQGLFQRALQLLFKRRRT
jgi:DnaJ domain